MAQSDADNFKNFQLSCARVSDAWKKYNDSLAKDFKKKNIAYPPKDIFLRAFKAQNELELWGRNNENSEYKMIKLYHICALSGFLGPKRAEGDRQVPEGYYFIEDFNPKSEYYLSMLLNYPNYSDNLQSTKAKRGGDIYIHGGCVTVGCMPMTDEGIQEIYTLCLNAKVNGEENIPVHIYPTRLNEKGWSYLAREYAAYPEKQVFWATLRAGYDYFEKHHKILPVMYTPDGRYAN
ncbi:MAG: L,D-transpeptidase family protein [Taibaiella sp.]|nr:L,D-transpeptidase family protein [Taibaiella sp.]